MTTTKELLVMEAEQYVRKQKPYACSFWLPEEDSGYCDKEFRTKNELLEHIVYEHLVPFQIEIG